MLKSLYAVDAEFLTREQAKALSDRVLSFAKADETRVNITSGWNGNTRFAGNEITTSGGTTDTTVTVTSTIGKKRASATTNVLGRPAARDVHFVSCVNHDADFDGRMPRPISRTPPTRQPLQKAGSG